MDVENLNSMMLDILGEIGNIGSGNAATALANMLSKRVDMDVPQVKVLEFKDVAEILGGEEKLVVGIYLDLNEEVEGNIMFIGTANPIPSALVTLTVLIPMTSPFIFIRAPPLFPGLIEASVCIRSSMKLPSDISIVLFNALIIPVIVGSF